MGLVWDGIWNDDDFRQLGESQQMLLLGLMSLSNHHGEVRMSAKAIWATIDPDERHPFAEFQEDLSALCQPPKRRRFNNLVSPDPLVGTSWLMPGRFITLDLNYERPLRVPVPAATKRAVVERDGMVCQLCGDEIPDGDLHIDHIQPVARGGGNELNNLQAAHSRCNISKGARV